MIEKTIGSAPCKIAGACAKAGALALLAAAAAPQAAWADDGTNAGFLTDVKAIFDNISDIGWAIYYGILGIFFVITLIYFGRAIVPAMVRAHRDDDPKFKSYVRGCVVAAVLLVGFGLAPVLVPSLFAYFGATANVNFNQTV